MQTTKAQLYLFINPYLVSSLTMFRQNQAMIDTSDAAVAARLGLAMERASVSNTSLAAKCDSSVQAVGEWRRSGKIARTRLPCISRVLRISIDWLLTGEIPVYAINEPKAPYSLSREVDELLSGLTSDQQRRILNDLKKTKESNEKVLEELSEKHGAA